jgi:hypothetical protein
MVRRVTLRLTFVLIPCLAAGLLTAARADEKSGELSPAEQVRKALDKPIDLDLKEDSLQKAVEKLRETTKLNITMYSAPASVDVANFLGGIAVPGGLPGGLGGLVPLLPGGAPGGAVPVRDVATVQLTVKGIKTRDALKKLFSPYGLSPYIIEDEVFLAPEDVGVRRQLSQRVSLDLNEVTLADALKRLGRERAINLLVSREGAKGAEKKISLQVDDVPLETAVRLLADQAGLRAARIDNVLIVTTPEHAKQINADNAARKQTESVPGAGAGYGNPPGYPVEKLLQLIDRQAPLNFVIPKS